VPRLRLDRAAIALVGAAAMLAFGVLDLRDAAKAVEYETIILLFGMMVLVAYLRMARVLYSRDRSRCGPGAPARTRSLPSSSG